MKVAICYENGQIFQHYGKTKEFMIYEIDSNEITNKYILESGEYSHKTLATLLKINNVNAIICGSLGTHAVKTLTEAGIEIFNGYTGNVDDAIKEYIKGNLVFNPTATHECHH